MCTLTACHVPLGQDQMKIFLLCERYFMTYLKDRYLDYKTGRVHPDKYFYNRIQKGLLYSCCFQNSYFYGEKISYKINKLPIGMRIISMQHTVSFITKYTDLLEYKTLSLQSNIPSLFLMYEQSNLHILHVLVMVTRT